MSTCEYDRQDDVCWECRDQRIDAPERDLAVLTGAAQAVWDTVPAEWSDSPGSTRVQDHARSLNALGELLNKEDTA